MPHHTQITQMAGLRIWLFCVLLAVEHVGSQPAERPDIGGEWEITYSFNERRGDRGILGYLLEWATCSYLIFLASRITIINAKYLLVTQS